jgi:hypothetical protein
MKHITIEQTRVYRVAVDVKVRVKLHLTDHGTGKGEELDDVEYLDRGALDTLDVLEKEGKVLNIDGQGFEDYESIVPLDEIRTVEEVK